MKKRIKDYTEMTTRELAEATKEFDQESVRPPGRPITREERTRFDAAKNRGGRPKTGEGVQVISLSIERGLLRSADLAARRRKLSRAQFIAEAVAAKLRRKSA